MTTRTTAAGVPRRAARPAKTNPLGLEKTSYRGRPSTLCKGCGHDSISQRIVNAAWELGLDQTQVVKLSGIGCSSKTPAYYLGWSHGFNSLHGRMPSVATGAIIANTELQVDRRQRGTATPPRSVLASSSTPCGATCPWYISSKIMACMASQKASSALPPTRVSFSSIKVVNDLPPLDICMEALTANATFVARSFAGDIKQAEALLKAAMNHRGIAVLDIISPCVTFNNHDTSTKSYGFGRAHEIRLHDLNFVPEFEEIEIEEYEDEIEVELHDGGSIMLKKIDPDHDPKDRAAAYNVIQRSLDEQKLITGLLYISEEEPTFTELLNLTDTPLTQLSQDKLLPSREGLQEVMASLS